MAPYHIGSLPVKLKMEETEFKPLSGDELKLQMGAPKYLVLNITTNSTHVAVGLGAARDYCLEHPDGECHIIQTIS